MDTVDKTLDRIYCELNDILQHPKLDKQDVELMGDFIDMLKDVAEMDSYSEPSGYSQMGGYMRGRSGRMPMYGRYNRDSSYGRDGGYSRSSNKEEILDRLQDAMDIAVDEKDRKAVGRLIEQMENR